jgi:uncharacterized protein YoxC
MALDEVLASLNELISVLPAEAVDRILGLVLVLKALGIAAIVYVIYVVAMGIFTYRRMKQVEHIEKKADRIEGKTDAIDKKIDSIDKKLNKLIKK